MVSSVPNHEKPIGGKPRAAVKSRKVLWVAPNLNHYKSRFLNRLAVDGDLDLVVLAGVQRIDEGHRAAELKKEYEVISIQVDKPRFGLSVLVFFAFLRLIVSRRFDVVLLPSEKKLLPLIVVAWAMRPFMRFELASYNHPMVRSGTVQKTRRDVWFSRIMFLFYDRVVFYTENSRQRAVETGLISPEKASFANNTLDTNEIWSNYTFEINRCEPKTILYVARLIRSKGVRDLLDYFHALSAKLPQLRLIVIGDGPQAELIKSAAQKCPRIIWYGAVVDEVKIANCMRKAHVVFMPGASGLSIVHAFCYGKPYVTLAEGRYPHGPEFSYLSDGVNGLVLDGDMSHNVDRLISLMSCDKRYTEMCKAARDSAKALSVNEWCRQMGHALTSPAVR